MKRLYRTNRLHFLSRNSFVKAALFASFALFCIIFSSCRNPINGTVSLNCDAPKLLVHVQRDKESYRSIAPGTFDSDDIQLFIITGIDKDGNDYVSPEDFEIDSTGTGRITDIPKSIWNLTLHAYSDSEGNNEVLRGYATADTRNATVDVPFVLSSIPLIEDGGFSGSIDLKFKYSNATAFEKVDEIHMSLCDSVTYESLYSLGDAGIITRTENPEAFAAFIGSDGYGVTGQFSAGYYWLMVEFYTKLSDTASQKIGTYTELIDIEPNRTTEDTVSIQDILYKKPEKPDNLYVYRIDDSCSKDSYNAVITWNDNAINEDYFVIQVDEYNAAGTSVLNTYRIDYTNATSISENGIAWIDGSLFYNSTEYVIKLKTGKLYEIKVCSENSIGSSDFESRKVSKGVAYSGLATMSNKYKNKTLTGFGSPDNYHINTFSVTYNYANGILYETASSYSHSSSRVDYLIYENSDFSIFEPKAIASEAIADNDLEKQPSADFPVLFISGDLSKEWDCWKSLSSGSSGTTVTSISGWNNLVLTAFYKNTDSYVEELNRSAVALSWGGASHGTGDEATATLSAGTTITVTVNTGSNFDEMELHITEDDSVVVKTVAASNGSASFSFDLSSLHSLYNLKVAGRKNGISSNVLNLITITVGS